MNKILSLSLAATTSALVAAEPIVPQPKQVQVQGKAFTLTEHTAIRADEALLPLAKLLAHEIEVLTGFTPNIYQTSHKILLESEIALRKSTDQKEPAESYSLQTSPKNLTIVGADANGAYYGSRTLLQYLQNHKNKVPALSIKDSPEFPVRSVLVDVGRKFMPVEDLKDWIRMMGWMKLNELHFHLNDNSWGRYPGYRLESKIFPNLPSKDGHYTFKQIRELQDFAKLHGVTIIPEIDSPGHALAFTNLKPELAQNEMNRNGFGLAYLDLHNPDAIRFMEQIFDEVAPLFDAKEFHIGTDEYRINLVKKKEDREALGEAFRQYINHCDEYLRKKHNKVTRIWSGYEHLPGTTEPNKTVVIDMWETSDAKVKSKAGYQVVNSSHFYTYIVPGAPYYGVNNQFIYDTWTPRQFSDKPEGQLEKSDPGLLGGKLHIWNDFGPTGHTWNEIARLSLPSMATMGEKLWGSKGYENYQAFLQGTSKTTASIPTVKLLTREAAADGFVWQLESPRHHIGNTTYPSELKSENLEYPWTASFTLTRHNDIAGNETLLSSKLATLFLDLEHSTVDKKTKQETKHKGIGLVRANQAPGYDPITSYRPDILVWNYQVPLGKETTITLVGEKRKTSLYIDDKLIGSKNIQTVCPLTHIGDPDLPRGFHGILHKASIKSSAPVSHSLGAWSPDTLKSSPAVLTLDVSKVIANGPNHVEFNYTSGLHGLDISKVELLADGKVIHTDDHAGFTGGKPRQNRYTLKLDNKKQGVTYTLKAHVSGAGGSDSSGSILLTESL
ncbi:beta-N-acetylhexosaminidase [Rubritalea tangerina]|uniref:Glycoside hydrolase family 20 protein n=1 Tax=Rubritalea tangerina TaxID=430798 RepID=A0ABW4ZEN3_9BACT